MVARQRVQGLPWLSPRGSESPAGSLQRDEVVDDSWTVQTLVDVTYPTKCNTNDMAALTLKSDSMQILSLLSGLPVAPFSMGNQCVWDLWLRTCVRWLVLHGHLMELCNWQVFPALAHRTLHCSTDRFTLIYYLWRLLKKFAVWIKFRSICWTLVWKYPLIYCQESIFGAQTDEKLTINQPFSFGTLSPVGFLLVVFFSNQ